MVERVSADPRVCGSNPARDHRDCFIRLVMKQIMGAFIHLESINVIASLINSRTMPRPGFEPLPLRAT